MDSKNLEAFVRLYERRSLRQAAADLYISPQGLGRTLQNLEAELDVILFARTPQGLVPTREGTYLYEQAGELLRKSEQIRRDLQNYAGRSWSVIILTNQENTLWRRIIMKIKAAVTHSNGAPFRTEPVELAEPKAGELLVKIAACGVCHTDEAAQYEEVPTPLPAVLGHEGAGIVEKVGEGVTEFKPGDRVGFSFAFCCHCKNCRTGHVASCSDFNRINFGGILREGTSRLSQNGKPLSMFFGQSAFAEYAVVDAENTVKVPYDDIDLGVVAPLGCGIQTGAGTVLNRLRPEFGSSIVVFGCGTVGMSAIMAARIAGCAQIIGVGGNQKSLDLALELGATHVINRKTCDDIVGEIRKITGGGANYSIDTSGVADFVRKGLHCLAPRGVEAIVGITPPMEIDMFGELMGEGKTIMGVTEGDATPKIFIPQMLEYYRQGRFPIDRIMKFYRFEEINKAFEESHNGGAIKAVLRMD